MWSNHVVGFVANDLYYFSASNLLWFLPQPLSKYRAYPEVTQIATAARNGTRHGVRDHLQMLLRDAHRFFGLLPVRNVSCDFCYSYDVPERVFNGRVR